MGLPASKLLCIAVLAFAPACLGDDPAQTNFSPIGSSKLHSPVGDDGLGARPEVMPPKSRVQAADVQLPQNLDYVEEVAGGGQIPIEPQHILTAADIQPQHILTAADIDPFHITTAADIQPVVLLLHHFDDNGVEHISVLDEKAQRGE